MACTTLWRSSDIGKIPWKMLNSTPPPPPPPPDWKSWRKPGTGTAAVLPLHVSGWLEMFHLTPTLTSHTWSSWFPGKIIIYDFTYCAMAILIFTFTQNLHAIACYSLRLWTKLVYFRLQCRTNESVSIKFTMVPFTFSLRSLSTQSTTT